MHAAALAERLDVGTVRVPRADGVLSALGLLAADEQYDTLRTVQTRLDAADPAAVESRFEELSEAVRAEASDDDRVRIERSADLRYVGQSHELTVDVPTPFAAGAVADRFERAHERTRGYTLADEPLQLVTLRASATIPGTTPEISHGGTNTARVDTRRVTFGEARHETPVRDRDTVSVGETVAGPAILTGDESTAVVPPEWTATADDRGTLVVEER
jgi:N-methylhydantoinase A